MRTIALPKVSLSRSMVIGASFLLLSALLTSISQVYYANKVQGVHPFLFTGVSFFITAVLFHMIAFRQLKQINIRALSSISDVVKLNGSSVLAFMGFYYALKFVEPAIVSSLEMAVGPLFVIVITAVMTKQKIRATRIQWVITALTFSASLFLVLTAMFGFSGVQVTHTRDLIFGIVASVLCGLGAVLCTIYSKRLSNAGWTSSSILAHRFYAIILVSFLTTYETLPTYLMENINWILLVAIFGVTAPTYLLQKGIQYCEPFIVMMSICFIPAFTFFFQLFDPRIVWSTPTLIGVSMLLLLGIASVFTENEE
ncbi:DMT family transporter [Sporosarcina obsidiansis]|uniref:DMT family transporter n=1 Tax=Sporosarcina obsidiansis TaxID=2660748 RepID=UPI00129B3E06|nr:DMT family transporter [Sporosarcina obsidiansis]